MTGIVKVLVVDDSAYVRKVVTSMLSRSPFLEVVATARDGREALELVEERHPDLVTCDLNMPDMDGVAFIREQMSRRRLPIVVMSVANASGEQVLAALEAGAVDFVHKPTALASERLMDVADELIQKVKLAATASFRAVGSADVPASPEVVRRPFVARPGAAPLDIVVLGISTGGPQGLKSVIPHLPADLPVPVAIVLHMPVGYTELYAKKLNELCALDVVEAREGDAIVAGRVFLAPAGRHLSFRSAGAGVVAHLDVRPLDTPHRPAVDVLFQSAADVFGERTLGVVMTGMGADGRAGSSWIKAKGGRILTEAESSCVVYGMPRSVVEAGLSDACVPLERMAEAIMEHL
jgi:two-component system, chemotaxis family, protein-glutamate methylesterase/glutaminase